MRVGNAHGSACMTARAQFSGDTARIKAGFRVKLRLMECASHQREARGLILANIFIRTNRFFLISGSE